jgi:hypothetical protein
LLERLNMGFGLVIGFIEHLQNISSNNYGSLTELYCKDHCNYNTHKVFSVYYAFV